MTKHVAIENPNEVAPATARSPATHARKMANHAITTAGGLSPMTAQAMAFPFMVLTQCRNGSAPHSLGRIEGGGVAPTQVGARTRKPSLTSSGVILSQQRTSSGQP